MRYKEKGGTKNGRTYEISTIRRQSCIKTVRSRRNNKIRNCIPGQAQEKPQQAEVIAVGPGGTVDGKEVKMEVTVGQISYLF